MEMSNIQFTTHRYGTLVASTES